MEIEVDRELWPVGTTPVHIAINSGRTDGLQALLDREASLIDTPDQYGRAPLALALQNGRLEAARILIKSGAKLDSRLGMGGESIAVALTTSPNYFTLLQSLVENNVTLPRSVDFLLPIAAYEGNAALVERVLCSYSCRVDCRDKLGCTALHYASQRGFSTIVSLLLSYRANRRLANSWGTTALHLACSAGHLHVVVALLEMDSSLEMNTSFLTAKNAGGSTPLTCALTNKDFDVALYLLKTHGKHLDFSQLHSDGHTLPSLLFHMRFLAQPSPVPTPYWTALPCLSSEEALWMLVTGVCANSTEAIHSAISQGAITECVDFMQQTPLILAARLGHIEACEALIQRGADPQQGDCLKRTPLQHAISHDRQEIVAFLLPHYKSVDPHSLTGPLNTTMLGLLVSYLEKGQNAVTSTSDWLAWLALAAPTAPKQVFTALVHDVAPPDWIHQLVTLAEDPQSRVQQGTPALVSAHCRTLPVCVNESTHPPKPPKAKLVRSFSQPRKWYFALPPPSSTSLWVFKTLPLPKKQPPRLKHKKKPFHCCKVRGGVAPSAVIHKAALHNLAVFRYIVGACESTGLQTQVLLSRDAMGRTALELVLPHFDAVSEAVEFLQLSECAALDAHLNQQYPLPDTLLFEEVLIQYLCIGLCKKSQPKKLQSPLQAWPMWYLQQQVNAFCNNLGTGLLCLNEEQDRKDLLQFLLNKNFFPSSWEEYEYPSPLYAAVQSQSTWAVAALLQHGADPATHFRGRLALTEAVQQCQVPILQLVVQHGYAPFQALANSDTLYSSLLPALVTLASSNHLECVLNIIHGLDLSQALWCSRHGLRLLFVSQASYEGTDVFKTLLLNFVIFLSNMVASWTGTEYKIRSSMERNVKLLNRMPFMAAPSQATLDLKHCTSIYCKYVKKGVTFASFFHALCSLGYHKLVAFLLNCSEGLVNVCDPFGRSPLFYAACGGHLSVVQLLLEHGATLDSASSAASPIVGALLYLACAPYYVGHRGLLGLSHNITALRLKYVSQLKNVLPMCNFSSAYEHPSSAQQLVKLLLPSKSSSVFSHLAIVPYNYRPFYVSYITLLLACARYTASLEPLLNRMACDEIPTDFISKFPNSALENFSTEGRYGLGEVIMLAPPHCNDQASQLFEAFLLHFTPKSKLSVNEIYFAAQKGYWSLLHTALSDNGIGELVYHPIRFSNIESQRHLYLTCQLAIKEGKLHMLSVLLKAHVSSGLFHPVRWSRVISQAVRLGHLDAVQEMLAAGGDPLVALEASARYGRTEAVSPLLECCPTNTLSHSFPRLVSIASQYNQLSFLEVLLNIYGKSEIDMGYGSTVDKNVTFWFCVLLHATRSGHQSLALQAVACIPETQIRSQVSKHPLYQNVLYYSCYWGLSEILQCIPITNDELTSSPLGSSPLEAALANGKLSCIPGLSSSLVPELFYPGSIAASLDDCEHFTPSRWMLLLTGYFYQLCSVDNQPSSTVDIVCQPKSHECYNIFIDAVYRSNPGAVPALQKLFGSNFSPIMLLLIEHINLSFRAVDACNTVLFEQVLRCLHNSGELGRVQTHSTLNALVSSGSIACNELFLRSGAFYVKEEMTYHWNNILHTAVKLKGQSAEFVELLLSWFGEYATDLCFAPDGGGCYPLYSAFNLGKYQRADKILRRIFCDGQLSHPVELDWRAQAKKAFGWYSAYIEEGSKQAVCLRGGGERRKAVGEVGEGVVKKGKEFDFACAYYNIRQQNLEQMFKYACYKNNNREVSALLTASCGLLLEDKELLQCCLLNQSVLEFLACLPPYVSLSQLDATDTICRAVARGHTREVKCLFRLLSQQQQRLEISVDQSKVFLAACSADSQSLVLYFLENMSLAASTLTSGCQHAIHFGHLETASTILLSVPGGATMGLSWSSDVVKTIFLSDKDYYSVVEDFFGSMARIELKHHRLSFSEAWLAHCWGPAQARLINRRLGGLQTPSNPWALGVQWRGQPLLATVTIDWQSFADSMLSSLAETSTIPLQLEAVVFSSAGLAPLCSKEEEESWDLAMFFDSSVPPSSLMVSAVTWPHPPSAGLTSAGDGLLTLSYRPEERAFVFPPTQCSEQSVNASVSTDSGLQLFCSTDYGNNISQHEEANYPDVISDLTTYYEAKLKKQCNTSTSISVEGFSGSTTTSLVCSVLHTVLNCCLKAVQLAWCPTVAYASIDQRRYHHVLSPPSGTIFSHIGINVFPTEEEEVEAATVVSVIDSALDITVHLPFFTCLESVSVPSFDTLLQQTVNCLLNSEVGHLKRRLSRELTHRIIPSIHKSLKNSVTSDGVELLIEDVNGTASKLKDATVEHLLPLKALPHINNFLHHFLDILSVHSLNPRVASILCQYFQVGFKVVISERSPSSLVFREEVTHLTICLKDLWHPHNQIALLSILSSLTDLIPSSKKQTLTEIFTGSPCPFLTWVDLESSKNFLFPKLGHPSKLVIQLMNYKQERLNLPLKYNCCLRVVIESPSLKTLVTSSSDEPSISTTSKNLFVATSKGQFVVVWNPQEAGMHSLSLSLNGAKIQEPFTRVFVPEKQTEGSNGKRQAKAGTILFFAAAHMGSPCSYSTPPAPIILTKRNPLKLSPFLKSPSSYGDFVPPTHPTFPAMSTSSSTVSGPARLKELVSAAAGPVAGGNHKHCDTSLPALHHLSVTSAYGGSRKWTHVDTPAVTVHITYEEREECGSHHRNKMKKKKFETKNKKKNKEKKQSQHRVKVMSPKAFCISLGRGMYMVGLECNLAGTYRIFTSCPTCQSVMKIIWFEGETFLPQPFYILPGPFSADRSVISRSKTHFYPVLGGRSGRKTRGCSGKNGVLLGSFRAGQHFTLYLKVYDSLGNAHTSGGAVKKAVICNAWRENLSSDSPLEAIWSHTQRPDSNCIVSNIGNSIYELLCIAFSAGLRPLFITCTQTDTATFMTTVHIVPATIYPPHCRLDPANSYEATLNQEYSFCMYTYDRYFNPCCPKKSSDVLSTSAGGQLFKAEYSIPPAHSRDNLCRKCLKSIPSQSKPNCATFTFCPKLLTANKLYIRLNGGSFPLSPLPFRVKCIESFPKRLSRFMRSVERERSAYHGVITVDRSRILDSALYNEQYFNSTVRVRFVGELGFDTGGVAREYFHLLCLEFINPAYALFQSVNGLFRPNPCSHINPNHLHHFNLFGKVLARMISDSNQTVVWFTPAVYKSLLRLECTLDDLEIEDPSLHKGLMEILACDSEEALHQLDWTFTASHAYFGRLETVELEPLGREKAVIIRNREEFVNKLYKWYLTGCVKRQLQCLKQGFDKLLPHVMISVFSPDELEMILCGQSTIDLAFMRRRTSYIGYSSESSVVVWLWEILESLSHEEQSHFLQFTTGSPCLPSADAGNWIMVIKEGSDNESLLPTASTCINTITLPHYQTKALLRQKIQQALDYARQLFQLC